MAAVELAVASVMSAEVASRFKEPAHIHTPTDTHIHTHTKTHIHHTHRYTHTYSHADTHTHTHNIQCTKYTTILS